MRAAALPAELATIAFTVPEARAAGLTLGRLRAADLEAPFHGVRRAAAHADPSRLGPIRDIAPRLKEWQFFSHTSAATIWGIPLPPWTQHLAVHVSAQAPRREPRTDGAIGHRLDIRSEWLTTRTGLPVPTPAETWAQLGELGVDALVVAGDFLIGPSRLATIDELTDAVARVRRRGAPSLRAALVETRPGSESPRETETRLLLTRGGLPEPEINWNLCDPQGRFVARLDLAYPQWKLGIEYDGRHHADAVQFARDADRWTAIEEQGWRIIRVLAHHFENPERDVLLRTRRVLKSRGWSGL